MKLTASISSSIALIMLVTIGVAANPVRAEAKPPGKGIGRDTTPPKIVPPANITAEATSATGALVYFSAFVTDDADPAPTVTYSLTSGSRFPIATTTVTVTATDWKRNTSKATFTVTVRDTTPPTIVCPEDILRDVNDADGAVVTFAASVGDAVDPSPTVTYSTASGSTFPDGTTTVTVTATDRSGNTATGSFHVTYDGDLTDCPFAGTYTTSWIGWDYISGDPITFYEWSITISPDGTVSGLGQQTALEVVDAYADDWDVWFYTVGYAPMPEGLSASTALDGHVTDAGSLQYGLELELWTYYPPNEMAWFGTRGPESWTQGVSLDGDGNLLLGGGEVWYRQ